MFIKHGQLLFKLSVIILNSQQLLHTDEPMLSIQDHTLNFGEKKSFGHLQACGHFHFRSVSYTHWCRYSRRIRGGSRGGGAHPAGAPLKLEKIWFFGVKSWFFHTKYPKNFRASLRNWKKYHFFGVKSWFFTRNTPKIFAPPSTQRNFF